MRDSMTKKERIIYLLENKPEMSPSEMTRMVGCSGPYFYTVRKNYFVDKEVAAILTESGDPEVHCGRETLAFSGSTEIEPFDPKHRKRAVVFVVVVLALFGVLLAV